MRVRRFRRISVLNPPFTIGSYVTQEERRTWQRQEDRQHGRKEADRREDSKATSEEVSAQERC